MGSDHAGLAPSFVDSLHLFLAFSLYDVGGRQQDQLSVACFSRGLKELMHVNIIETQGVRKSAGTTSLEMADGC